MQPKALDVPENLALFYEAGHNHIRALQDFPVNTILHPFGAREYVEKPTYLSVQVDEDKHIHLFPEFLQYINHSCDPNTFFDTTNGVVVVIKAIDKGEELTWFYPSTEWSMTQPFECFCKTASCLGTIRGAACLSDDAILKYRFSDHIVRKLCGRV
jgi:SET domain